MEQGTVTWFNDAKGDGFISRQNSEDASCTSPLFRQAVSAACKKDNPCIFDLTKGPKGWQAEDVQAV